MQKYRKLINRFIVYCVGLLIMAFGVSLAIHSNLGVSPVSSLPNVLGQLIHVSVGTCVTGVFCFYSLLQILLLRKDFKWINLAQIIIASVFGYFVDFTDMLLGNLVIPGGYLGRVVVMAISLTCASIGTTLYMEAKLINVPMEGLTVAISEKFNIPFPKVRRTADCTILAIAAVLSIVFLGKIYGIREGTVISALFLGKMIGVVKKRVSPTIQRLCFEEVADAGVREDVPEGLQGVEEIPEIAEVDVATL